MSAAYIFDWVMIVLSWAYIVGLLSYILYVLWQAVRGESTRSNRK